ncbi:MAG: ribosome silencing factor [Chloroflexi bacterium]|nr:ribosome silencing factor [Chloroflexota bacterium]MDA1146159.1 ribosome silencing factor [Chloroflexota bacterium]
MPVESESSTVVDPLRPDVDLAHEVVDWLADRQVADIVLLDLTPLAAFADFFVIGTIDNIRQARAAIEGVEAGIRDRVDARVRPEGSPESGWVLLDTGTGILVHLFSPEARLRYDLEGLWNKAQEVVRVQ